MSHLRVTLVAFAAVLLVGCGSGPSTAPAGTAANTDKPVEAPAKPDGTPGAKATTMQMQPGPGAGGADTRIGSKAK